MLKFQLLFVRFCIRCTHLVQFSGTHFFHIEGTHPVHFSGTLNVLAACRLFKAHRLIFTSTVDVVAGYESIQYGDERSVQ